MHSLSVLHSFGFGYSAANLLSIDSVASIHQVFSSIKDQHFIVLGAGSNSVFVEDYAGTLVKIDLQGIEYTDSVDYHQVSVAAGENWHEFVCWCLQRDIRGLENLALIPGTVGAAPIQNIGAYGAEVAEFIARVEYFDLKDMRLKCLDVEQCQFTYRNSIFKSKWGQQLIITSVVFRIPKAWNANTKYGELAELVAPSAQDIFERVIAVRRKKLPDPELVGNAGSFFKNPVVSSSHGEKLKQAWPELPQYPATLGKVKLSAAWMIDKLGFKGKTLGGITCHAQQALVLINDGSGTGPQLLTLAREIRQSVQSEFGVWLENEVRLIGEHGVIEL